jgi:N-sulfoglucosamine sulfohydrolase
MRTLPLLLFCAVGWAGERNVVLYVADDLGREIGCYGDPAVKTPHLDALAAQGVRFEHAFATTASCSASRSVILSGLHNHATGQYGHAHSFHHFKSFGKLRTLPARLSGAGYRTARIGKYHVEPQEVYPFEEVLRNPGGDRSSVQMADACRPFLEAEDERPFFLYICTSDPHRGGGKVPGGADRFGNRKKGYPGVEEVTYDPGEVTVPTYLPDTPVSRDEWAQYAQSASRVDQGVGRLLQVLDEAGHTDDTLVLFTSDHGVAFPGAKTTCYEGGLGVPLIARAPGAIEAGQVSDAMVSHVDLAPTILAWAGVEIGAGEVHGRSWLGALEDPAGWDTVFASHTFHEVTMYYPMRVIRTRRWKLIWNVAHGLPFPFATDLWAASTWQQALAQGPRTPYGPWTVEGYVNRPRFELYDLQEDPWESTNLAGVQGEVLEQMKAGLRGFQKRTNDPWVSKWKYE